MTFVDFGILFSEILFFASGGLLIFGSYISYREFSKLQSEAAQVKLITKYHFFGAFGIGLSTFVIFIVLMGFTWENLGFSIILAAATLGFSVFDNFIRLKTIRFLKRRK